MSLALVVKLGGDALASPERIAAEAGRIARLAGAGPVVAVASARRGVTDRLLGLADAVDTAARQFDDAARLLPRESAERDRVVASGEVVAAALLALALNRLGVRAVSLDAREAGIAAAGRFGGARIHRVHPRRIAQLLARGVVPVVTGFQGWRRGRVATLHRGGTDASAIAVAAALGSSRVLFVKDAEGLRTADPKLVPESRPIRHAPHRFLTALTAAGARVVQAEAAVLAEATGITLEFHPLGRDAAVSVVAAAARGTGLRAVASAHRNDGTCQITVVAADGSPLNGLVEPIHAALAAAGIPLASMHPGAGGLGLVVGEANLTSALRAVHAVAVEGGRCTEAARRAS